MATTLPPLPNPPPPQVTRFDDKGKPTVAQITYETQLMAFFKAVQAAVETI